MSQARNASAVRVVAALIALLTIPVAAAVRAQAPGPGAALQGTPHVAGEVLVTFRRECSPATRLQAIRRQGLVPCGGQGASFARLRVPSVGATPDDSLAITLQQLKQDPTVEYAEPNLTYSVSRLPNDTRFSELWGLHNIGQSGGIQSADISAPRAWDSSTGGSATSAPIVAVIDTGVDYTHPDLKDNILKDAAGKLVGYDFFNDDADPMDDDGHGTHVAGTIGARGDNSMGVVGVNWVARIMPLKAGDGTGLPLSAIVSSIDFAIANGARVINASFGGTGFSQIQLAAVQRARNAGVLFVAAAGNDGANNDVIPHYPANFNSLSDNVISVAATDRRDDLATFSDYGDSVDIAAPGVEILSTGIGNTYVELQGTSMAAPHVTGAAALILSAVPSQTYLEVKQRLLNSAVRLPSLTGVIAGGRLTAG
jgi:serine protease